MQTDKNKAGNTESSKTTTQRETEKQSNDDVVKAAHDQAEEDIENDPELSAHSPNDDLDEAETARLGEDETGLV